MMQLVFSSNKGADQLHGSLHDELALFHVAAHSKSVLLEKNKGAYQLRSSAAYLHL